MTRTSKKIKWLTHWDWHSIRITIGITSTLFGVMLVYYFGQSLWREVRLTQFDGETTGMLVEVTTQKRMSQGYAGNKVVTDCYIIKYSYTAKGRSYTATDRIFVDRLNTFSLKKLIKTNTDSLVHVRYDTQHPRNSMIDLE